MQMTNNEKLIAIIELIEHLAIDIINKKHEQEGYIAEELFEFSQKLKMQISQDK